ncbi:MAG TPA: NAD(P)/FAD-dependent oxidoreductase [Acidimicrobiales bacterium]
MYDAIVVGARCAGSSTARLLAQRGHRVLVVDRATFPSDTVSTHCIDPVGMRLLHDWGLAEKVFATNTPPLTKFVLTAGQVEYPADAPGAICAPRRTVLDKLLVDEAVAAGAEVREGVSVKELLRDGDRVTGIAAVDANGDGFEAQARVVVGADGTNSFVARAVDAEKYDERFAKGVGYYAYYSGTPFENVELAFDLNRFAGIFPTNDGEVCVFAAREADDFPNMRSDPDAAVIETLLDVNPRIGEGTRNGTRTSRFFKYDAEPGFFRKPYGDGWALVGDAGFHIDPVTGRGIGHAFRDAELLSRALHAGWSGEAPMAEALAGYHATRDDLSRDIYDWTQQIASLQWNPDELLGLFMNVMMKTIELMDAVPGSSPASPASSGEPVSA